MYKILLVEDDPDQIMIYQTKFEMEGLFMMIADNGRDAVKIARADGPDLILLDLLLRHENGLDVLEEIKKYPEAKDIPVVVFTNYDTKEMRARAQSLGVLEYIIKTQITPNEIVTKIKEILDGKKGS